MSEVHRLEVHLDMTLALDGQDTPGHQVEREGSGAEALVVDLVEAAGVSEVGALRETGKPA